MAVKVYFSATLKNFVNKKSSFEISSNSVEGAVNFFIDEYPEIKNIFFDENDNFRPFINVFVNQVNIKDLNGFQTVLKDNDELLFLPSIAGGAPTDEKNDSFESVISSERRKEVKLNDEEIELFSKHLMIEKIGVKGQKNLKAARVLVCHLGALGSQVVQILCESGVGTIGLCDFDFVSISDLQNQVLYSRRDLKRPKVMAAKDKIKAVNPSINVEIFSEKLDSQNVLNIFENYDIIADCTDNYKSRYLINDACVLLNKIEVFAAIYQSEGQVMVFNKSEGPCLRCVYPSPAPSSLIPTCSQSGIISSLPGIIGSIQANEILKLIIGSSFQDFSTMIVFDSWNNRFNKVKFSKNCECEICSSHKTITQIEDYDYEEFCGLKEDESEIPVEGVDAMELLSRIEKGEKFTIVDVREPHERSVCRFPDAIVIPIGQLERRMKELNPDVNTVFICREGKRSVLAIRTLREAGYKGPLYNLKGGIEASKNIIFPHEGAWL